MEIELIYAEAARTLKFASTADQKFQKLKELVTKDLGVEQFLLVDARTKVELSAAPSDDLICSEKRKQISFFVFNEAITTEGQLLESIEREHSKNLLSET